MRSVWFAVTWIFAKLGLRRAMGWAHVKWLRAHCRSFTETHS